MKIKHLILIISFFIAGIAVAQPGGEKVREKIRTLQIAYFTEQLELTSSEAQEFWPVYNKLTQQRRNSEKQKRKLLKNIEADFDSLTEEETREHISTLQAIDMMQTNLDATYSSQLIEIIGAKRYLLLKKAEQDFKRKMLEEFKNRRSGMRRR